MALADDWKSIESGLDPSWSTALLALTVEDARARDRAAALLAPAGPWRAGSTIRLTVARRGGGVGPEAVTRMLRRIDGERLHGRLELVSAAEAPVAEPAAATRRSLAADWDTAVAALPGDWSETLCELELVSTDHLDRAALLLAPVNPRLGEEGLRLRFRSASTHGYGASPGMARRCLARLDEAGIPGTLRLVLASSDTHPAATQGTVWYLRGRTA